MKSLLIATAVLAALPLMAAEETKPAESTKPADSPLAAAAKKGKRNDGKKRIVITNESVKNSKGHISTSNMPAELPAMKPLPPAKTEKELIQQKADEKKAAEAKIAADKKKAADDQKRLERMARAYENAEGEEAGYGEIDPAEAEKALEDAARPKP